MADVEFNGSQGIIPDFALESTQENILAALQKQFKLSDKDLKNAKNIFNNDNKNTKATIEALKKMGTDIADSIDGKGSVLGGLSAAGSGIASLGGYAVAAGAALVGMTAGIAKVSLSLAKGFGDDLKKAGLADTGAAFGDLGQELNVLVPGLMTFGLSMSEAGNAIQDFRTSMTMVSGSAIKDVIGTFQKITNGGAAYGRTISENIEFLSDEIEYRARLGFIDQANSKQAAHDAQEIMDSQINASKLLGKSVDEIANGVKDLFTGDIDIMASLATLGPNVEKELRKTFQTFEGAGLPKEFQAGLAKMITDPIMLGSEEAKNAFNALSVLPDDMGDSVRRDVEDLRAAMDLPEGTQGRQDAIAKANKNLEKSMLEMGNNINNLNKEEKEALFIQGQNIPFLKDLLASQRGFAAAYENFYNETNKDLNKSLENSVLFDNQITILTNTFNVLLSSVKSGMYPALEKFTTALGDISDENSPIAKFRVRLEDISGKIIGKFNDIFGLAGDQEENTNFVTGLLGTLGDMVESVADSFLTFFESLNDASGDTFMAKVGNFVQDMVGSLMAIIGDQIRAIDFMDLLFGDSRDEVVEDTAKKVDFDRQNIENSGYSQEVKDRRLEQFFDNRISDIQEFATDKELDPKQTLQMIRDAGIQVNELSGKKLLEMFPDPEDLKTAISGVYGEDVAQAQNLWVKASEKIIQHTDDVVKNTGLGFAKSLLETQDATTARVTAESEAKRMWATQKDTELALLAESSALQEIVVTATKRDQPTAEDLQDIVVTATKIDLPTAEDLQDIVVTATKIDLPTAEDLQEIVVTATKIDETIGTRPVATTATDIQKDPENAEPTTTGPSSQDGTKTQAVKSEPMEGDSSSNHVKEITEAIIIAIGPKLDLIATNTKKTASGVASLPDNIN